MNERGQYGPPRIGLEPRSGQPTGHTIAPWVLGGIGAAIGFALYGAHVTKRPQLSAHEKEVRAWEAEFPGLPWYADQVNARQLDTWERARNHWERAR